MIYDSDCSEAKCNIILIQLYNVFTQNFQSFLLMIFNFMFPVLYFSCSSFIHLNSN